MSKKSDDSIDRIFRQALTQYDTKFHGDDWLKMEKLLNEEAQRKAAARSRRIKGTAYTLTGLTGLFIVVYFLAIKNPSGTIANLSDSVTEMQASEALTENGNVKLENPSEGLLSQPSSDTAIDSQQKATVPSDETNISKLQPPAGKVKGSDNTDKALKITGNKASDGKTVADDGASTRNELPTAFKKQKITANPNIDLPGAFPNRNEDADEPGLDPSNKSNPSLTPPEETSNVEAVTDKLSKTSNGSEQTNLQATSGESGEGTFNDAEVVVQDSEKEQKTAHELISKPSTFLSTDSSSKVDLRSDAMLTDSTRSQGVTSSEEKSSKLNSHWSVAFVIAPEFSTTTLSSYSSPGDSYGLRIGYQLSNRLSANTGLIRSQKKYEGSGDGYKPRNPAYWQIRTNGVVPNEIYSKCLVYELPIGVQFDAIQTSKSRLFVSAAMSSYFMISQAYDYTFESPNPGADTGWRSRGSESYWFSVGMVSAGYERYITKSFAIGIEPYLKVSLAEIGWPNIKLYSTGAYVTLRYKFMNSRNIH